MYKIQFVFNLLSVIIITLIAASFANAQATRTWVSGVGDDANPCSRIAPCKTFAGAISKTAAGGEISVLDPGGYGGVTITKAITIDGGEQTASILVGGANGVIVNAGPNDVVTLRNLSINGIRQTTVPGTNGIRFLGGQILNVENVVIQNFNNFGIDFATSNAGFSFLLVKDTIIRSTIAGGINVVQPTNTAFVTIDSTRVENCIFGIKATNSSRVIIRNSFITSNGGEPGVSADGASTTVFIEGSAVSNNTIGLRARNSSVVHLSNATLSGNATGLTSDSGGQIISFGQNRIAGNIVNGLPTSTIFQQ